MLDKYGPDDIVVFLPGHDTTMEQLEAAFAHLKARKPQFSYNFENIPDFSKRKRF